MEFATQPIRREIKVEGFNSIYYFEFGKDFSHTPEMHDFWEFVYVDSGKINAITDGFGQTLKQGQIIFHKPFEVHAHLSDKVSPNNMLVVSFTCRSTAMEYFDKKIFDLGKTSKTLLSLFVEETKNALGAIPGDYNNKNPLDFSLAPPDSLQLLECYLTEFLITLKRHGEKSGNKIKKDEKSRNIAQSSIAELIISYIEDNIYNSVSVDDICSKFFMGKSQLYQLFDDYCGESPIKYHLKLKMIEAKKLLRYNEMSVSQISDALGYTSIHNFSRAFKKTSGISPTKYRKKISSP